MFRFLLSNLSSSWLRTLSIIFATFVSGCIGIIFYILYINLSSGISFYTLDHVDEKRFSLTAGSTVFQLFDRERGGIPDSILKKIANDESLERYRVFHFIDISVVGKFDLFTFSLDIDIPTFSVRESEKGIEGIGISTNMLKYYNLEFAGSHALFPVLSDTDILGTNVTLSFDASKVFSRPEKQEHMYSSQITHIDPDYPGFGVVIPYAIADQEMKKLGYKQNAPYKIIGYMHDISLRSEIESRYNGYILRFDADTIAEQKKIFQTLAKILASIMISILIILYGFLFLLFMGYFREKSYIDFLISQYKIESMGRYILLFLEPIVLIFIGSITGWILWIIVQPPLLGLLGYYLRSHNIFFPILSISVPMIGLIFCMSFAILLVLLSFSHRTEKK